MVTGINCDVFASDTLVRQHCCCTATKKFGFMYSGLVIPMLHCCVTRVVYNRMPEGNINSKETTLSIKNLHKYENICGIGIMNSFSTILWCDVKASHCCTLS